MDDGYEDDCECGRGHSLEEDHDEHGCKRYQCVCRIPQPFEFRCA